MRINTKKIENEIKRLGLSKNEFAARMGISRALLDHYLHGNPQTFKIYEKLGKALHLSPKDLII